MIRVLLELVVPLLLPTAAYAGWLAFDRRRVAELGAGAPRIWADAPWPWLIGLGLLLVGAITLALAFTEGEDIRGVHVPPRLEGGKVVPGHVDSPPPRR